MTDPNSHAVIEYGVTEAALSELREKNADLTEVTPDNYDTFKANLKELVSLRTGVETKRKELTKDALDWQRRVNDKAKEITAKIAAIEEPVKELKQAYDAELKEAKEREARKEQARVDKINGMIDEIEAAGRDLDGMTASELRERIDANKLTPPTEKAYQEFHAVALERYESTMARLTVAHGKAVEREVADQKRKEEAERLAKEREEFEREKREFEARQKAERDEIAKRESEQRAAEAKAAQEARDAEIAEQAAREALEAKEREEAEAAEREAEKLALAPDREKLQHYAGSIANLIAAAPEIDNAKAQKVLSRAIASLEATEAALTDAADRL